MTKLTTIEKDLINDAVAKGKVTKVKAGKARGVNKRTAPQTAAKPTRAQRGKSTAKRSAKTVARVQATARPAGTFTTVDIAKEQGMSAKTLRARIRRNIDDWAPLFHDGMKHVFKDNKTIRGKIEGLLA